MEEITVKQATAADKPSVARLLESAERIHLSFEVEDIGAWLDIQPFLLALAGDRLMGFILCTLRHPSRAWLGGLGLADNWPLETALRSLLPPALRSLSAQGATHLICMGNERWLVNPLQQRWGFETCDFVVTYVKRDWVVPGRGNPWVRIRPARPADIPALVDLDRITFKSLWSHSDLTFARILKESPYFVVATLEGRVVGYQFNHRRGEEGHLSRIAVHPAYQGQGIGVRLLAEAIDYFKGEGVRTITLNTQKHNLVSQRLYRWFGFQLVGEEVPVLRREL